MGIKFSNHSLVINKVEIYSMKIASVETNRPGRPK